MIGISLTDLIPSSYYMMINNYGVLYGNFLAIATFLLGGLLITLISSKIDKIGLKNNNLYKLGILNMIALMLHNLPEGMATFLSSYNNVSLGIKLSIAIMLHNIPEGISIAIPLYYSTNNKILAIKYTMISGLAEPLGAIISFLLFRNIINSINISIILIIVSGIMIFLSINKILHEALKYNEYEYIKYGIIIGILIIILGALL